MGQCHSIAERLLTVKNVQISVVVFLASAMVMKVVNSLKSRAPPGPWGVPILGTLPFFGKEPNVTFMQMQKKYGDVFSIQLGSWPGIVINGRKAIREALFEKGDAFSNRPQFMIATLIKKGITFSQLSPEYKSHRKLAINTLNMFATSKRSRLEEMLQREVDYIVQAFLEEGGEGFGPSEFIIMAAGSMIYQICYGMHEDIREDKDFAIFILNFYKFLNFAKAGNPIDVLPWLKHLMPGKVRQFKDFLTKSKGLRTKKIIEHDDTFNDTDLRDVTDRLLQLQRQGVIDDEMIHGTIGDMFGAGFTTIATSVEWIILFMAAHPEVQSKVQEEIDNVVGFTRMPSLEDQGKLVYTEAVIHESMRLASVTPLGIPHMAMEDTDLQGYRIKKDTVAFINLYSMARDEIVWGDPHVFRPERFLDENGEIRRSLLEEFLPFSLGRRKCLGEHLARMEVFLLTTGVLQKCRLLKPEDVEQYSMEASVGLVRSPQPYRVVVSSRH